MSNTAWVATRKGLFELAHDGQSWQIANVSFLAEPVSMVLPAGKPGERMLAALNLGHFGSKIHASDDAGKRWTEVGVPSYPPQPEGAPGSPWKLVQIWSMARDADGTMWAGTNPGGLFSSVDGGETWQLNESLWYRPERAEWAGGGYDSPGIHSICTREPGELLVGVSCGGAWRTSDGGQTWALRAAGMRAEYMPPEQAFDQNSQDPHCIVRCASAPDVLWCQHHNGIFRSTDNGARWEEIKAQPSSFGFAVAVHPREPDTAWFAPGIKDEKRIPVDAALCVTRTRDGGKTFEALRNGLPQQHCYDLIYRHGLVVDETGQRLLMGSTTGNLWASDDGGEHWDAVSLNLPPIYAVKFG